MGVVLLFFDGVGISAGDDSRNPVTGFAGQPFPLKETGEIMSDGQCLPTDATLGVEGLPQSATGQATILTGINAAALEGRHVNAFPTKVLRRLITDHSLLRQLKERGSNPVFANAYHPGYFARKHSRFSVSTWSWLAAGLHYRTLDDLRRGKAVSHDLTNTFMHRLGFQVPLRRPEQSGAILAELLREFDFVFFEYILTDVMGHRQNFGQAVKYLAEIREMMSALLTRLDLAQHQVVLTSDHGNVEDLSTNTHTRNPVPTLLWGDRFRSHDIRISTIEDITPMILELLTGERT